MTSPIVITVPTRRLLADEKRVVNSIEKISVVFRKYVPLVLRNRM